MVIIIIVVNIAYAPRERARIDCVRLISLKLVFISLLTTFK